MLANVDFLPCLICSTDSQCRYYDSKQKGRRRSFFQPMLNNGTARAWFGNNITGAGKNGNVRKPDVSSAGKIAVKTMLIPAIKCHKLYKPWLEILNANSYYQLRNRGYTNCHYFYRTDQETGDTTVRMIQPFIPGKQLALQLFDLPITEALNVFQQLASCLVTLQQAQLVHGDLHLENIHYDRCTNLVELVDFGRATSANSRGYRFPRPDYWLPKKRVISIDNNDCDSSFDDDKFAVIAHFLRYIFHITMKNFAAFTVSPDLKTVVMTFQDNTMLPISINQQWRSNRLQNYLQSPAIIMPYEKVINFTNLPLTLFCCLLNETAHAKAKTLQEHINRLLGEEVFGQVKILANAYQTNQVSEINFSQIITTMQQANNDSRTLEYRR